MRESPPSPPWGRGWPATGVFISRGRTGEGVKPVNTPYTYHKTRSLARTAGQIDKARELSRTPTETEGVAWGLLHSCVVATGGVGLSVFGLSPLTRPAPAGESAGCGPPSPQRGRGRRLTLARLEMYKLQARARRPWHARYRS
jgi:hypothetical protein